MTLFTYPLTFVPEFRQYLWGGRRLASIFHRPLPDGDVAESWEISGHPDSPTAVASGPYKGQTLQSLVGTLGLSLVGTNARRMFERHRFPLLVKLLDAHQRLSLQVHPDDAYAQEHEQGELGKTEMWYVLYAEPGAQLIHGLVPGTTRQELQRALTNGGTTCLLRHVTIHAGDTVYVPSGTVHALLEGTVVAEIQQTSDATYRVHDWGRVDADGNPRELHVAKALDVIAYDSPPAIQTPVLVREQDGVRTETLVSCPKFDVERVCLAPGAIYEDHCDGSTFEIWGLVEGSAQINPVGPAGWPTGPLVMSAVGWALLPAAMGSYRIASRGECTFLRVYLGQPV